MPSETESQNKKSKKDLATNYEINKITRTILKPAGTIRRLSVAAVIDGNYELEELKDGTEKRNYIPRSEQELKTFEEIVKKAMGYNEDREDQVSVSSIEFSKVVPMDSKAHVEDNKYLKLLQDYKKTIINLVLVIVVFFLIVRPLLKSVKNITKEVASARKELPVVSGEYAQIHESSKVGQKERVLEISASNPEGAQQLIKGWIGEQE